MRDEPVYAIVETPPLSELCLEDEHRCDACGGPIAPGEMVVAQPGKMWHDACWGNR